MWVLYVEIPMNFQVWEKEANIKGIIHSTYEIVSLSTFKLFKPCMRRAQDMTARSPFTFVVWKQHGSECDQEENQSYRTGTKWRWVNNLHFLANYSSQIFPSFPWQPSGCRLQPLQDKINKMSVPPRSHDSFCVLLHDSGPNGLTKPDFHTANSHQINPTVYTRRQIRCTQQNASKTPCKTLHAQSAILLHPKLRSLTEKKTNLYLTKSAVAW